METLIPVSSTTKQRICIEHNGCVYECDFQSSVIGTIQKSYPESGIVDNVLFTNLSKAVQSKLLNEILNEDDDYDID